MRLEVARRWLDVADHDLYIVSLCQRGDPQSVPGMAYHCQQAVEKLLKALLILAEVPFPKTHNLTELADLLPNDRPATIAVAVDRVSGLTAWGIVGRYPVTTAKPEMPTISELEAAIADIARLRALVATVIEEG